MRMYLPHVKEVSGVMMGSVTISAVAYPSLSASMSLRCVIGKGHPVPAFVVLSKHLCHPA